MKSARHVCVLGIHARTRCGALYRNRLRQLHFIVGIRTRAWHRSHFRSESLVARTKGHRPKVPRNLLRLVPERLVARIVNTRRHRLDIPLVLNVPLVVIIEPRARVTLCPFHDNQFLFLFYNYQQTK